MPAVNIPPDHMDAKMRLQHIVQLNCQSAPLKIGHTAESSGGCGTRQERKCGLSLKSRRKERIFQSSRRGMMLTVGYTEKLNLHIFCVKNLICPSYRLSLKGWRRPTELPGSTQFKFSFSCQKWDSTKPQRARAQSRDDLFFSLWVSVNQRNA